MKGASEVQGRLVGVRSMYICLFKDCSCLQFIYLKPAECAGKKQPPASSTNAAAGKRTEGTQAPADDKAKVGCCGFCKSKA